MRGSKRVLNAVSMFVLYCLHDTTLFFFKTLSLAR